MMTETATQITDAEFDRAWEYLAELGTCDSPGGTEYRRVKTEWLDTGRPAPLPFIKVRANCFYIPEHDWPFPVEHGDGFDERCEAVEYTPSVYTATVDEWSKWEQLREFDLCDHGYVFPGLPFDPP